MSIGMERQSDSSNADMRALIQENERLTAMLAAIQASRSWRLTAPLRMWAAMRRESAVDRMMSRNQRRARRNRPENVFIGPVPQFILRRSHETPRVCAVVHVFYPELAREIANGLARIEDLVVVFVSHPPTLCKSDFEAAFFDLMRRGVRVECVEVENRGRDVLPLVSLLDSLKAADCNAFVKLHTKRSPHLPSDTGETWRQSLIHGLLPGVDECGQIARVMASNPSIHFAVPLRWAAGAESWGRNRSRAKELAQRGGLRVPRRIVFPAGSMFWFGKQMIASLESIGLTGDDFEPELQQLDGTTAHAVERLFGALTPNAENLRLLYDPSSLACDRPVTDTRTPVGLDRRSSEVA